jgi:hypothetical protein
MMNQQDLIKCFHYYKLQFNGYFFKQKHGSHINTFKKIKSIIHLRLFTIYFLGKILYIEKTIILKNI